MKLAAILGLITAGLAVCGTVGGVAKWAHDSYYDERYVTVSSLDESKLREEIREKRDKIDELEFTTMSTEEKQRRKQKLQNQIEDRQRDLDRLKK